jgi:hypothetical protein
MRLKYMFSCSRSQRSVDASATLLWALVLLFARVIHARSKNNASPHAAFERRSNDDTRKAKVYSERVDMCKAQGFLPIRAWSLGIF